MDYTDIQKKLREGNLAETIPLLLRKTVDLGDWGLTEQAGNLWMTYQQMLRFMLQGINDTQSEHIRQDICQQLEFIACRMERLERIKLHPEEKYVSISKEMKRLPSFESIVTHLESLSAELNEVKTDELLRDSIRQHRMDDLIEQMDTAVIQLFNWTWTGEVWQHTDMEQAQRVLFSDTISSLDKTIFVSAVTLSLLEFADPAKLLFLLDGYLMDDDQVSVRSLVGFLLAFHLHYDRLCDNTELIDRLNIYHDDAAFLRDIYAVMMHLQMSCITDNVTSKMRNDIMPALIQGMTAKKKKEEKKDIDPNAFVEHGENPEWMDDEHTSKKMQEMAEMQIEGADIYYSTFAMMKGHAFFNQMPHWFYPFSLTASHAPEMRSLSHVAINKFVRLILSGTPFCNSDKYSLCFTFSSLGNMAESAIEAQINSQLPNVNIDELAESEELQSPKRADLMRHYVFDLYRFFNNYPYKLQFTNPFTLLKEHPIMPFSHPLLQQLLDETNEELAQYADFLMRKEFYAAALDIFQTLATNEFDLSLASIWQKVGFCHQKLHHTDETLHAYMVANSIKPNSKWTLSHLASLCATAGRMEEAAQYYQELLEIQPENQKYLIGAAQSLMQCDRYKEALPWLHKASYLDEQSDTAKQLLAWCLIVCGKKDEAANHILQLQAANATNLMAQQLLGIVMLMDGKMKDAHHLLRPLANDEMRADLHEKLNILARHQVLKPASVTLFMDALLLNIE
ncbi:MAG: hypothetical protein J5616_05025 [Bacteroidaceae bacterium]|nr:hypothetical protein [Bacteroidaceae bacterium]